METTVSKLSLSNGRFSASVSRSRGPRKVLANLLDLSSPGEQVASVSEPKFTERESEVLRLLVEGHPNRAIAQKLGIDLATVKKHVGTLMRKVGVKNRIALSVQVVNRKLLST